MVPRLVWLPVNTKVTGAFPQSTLLCWHPRHRQESMPSHRSASHVSTGRSNSPKVEVSGPRHAPDTHQTRTRGGLKDSHTTPLSGRRWGNQASSQKSVFGETRTLEPPPARGSQAAPSQSSIGPALSRESRLLPAFRLMRLQVVPIQANLSV